MLGVGEGKTFVTSDPGLQRHLSREGVCEVGWGGVTADGQKALACQAARGEQSTRWEVCSRICCPGIFYRHPQDGLWAALRDGVGGGNRREGAWGTDGALQQQPPAPCQVHQQSNGFEILNH